MARAPTILAASARGAHAGRPRGGEGSRTSGGIRGIQIALRHRGPRRLVQRHLCPPGGSDAIVVWAGRRKVPARRAQCPSGVAVLHLRGAVQHANNVVDISPRVDILCKLDGHGVVGVLGVQAPGVEEAVLVVLDDTCAQLFAHCLLWPESVRGKGRCGQRE